MKILISGSRGDIGRHITGRYLEKGDEVLGINRNGASSDIIHDNYAEYWVGDAKYLKKEYVKDAIVENNFHDLDALIIAHGHGPYIENICAIDQEIFEEIIKVDVVATLLIIQAALEFMKENYKGSIVIISSFHSVGTYPYRLCYSTAKSALVGMARSVAIEMGNRSINCNVISPGQVYGKRTDNIFHNNAEILRKIHDRSPTHLLTTKNEIVNVIDMLINTPSMNGQNIVIDNGASVNLYYEKI